MSTTTKYALRYPAGSDPTAIQDYFQHLAEDAEAVFAGFSQAVTRPAAGKVGRFHLQPSGGSGTPATNTLSYDDGSAWRTLGVLDPTLGLIIANLAGAAALTTYTEALVDLGSMGAAKTIDLSLANEFKGLLTANCTISLANVPAGSNKRLSFGLKLTQDATGSRTVTWPGSVNWGLAGAPVLTTTASKADFLSFMSDDAGTTWLGFIAGQGF